MSFKGIKGCVLQKTKLKNYKMAKVTFKNETTSRMQFGIFGYDKNSQKRRTAPPSGSDNTNAPPAGGCVVAAWTESNKEAVATRICAISDGTDYTVTVSGSGGSYEISITSS